MRSKREKRVLEVLIIVVFGAIVSVINTLWLRDNLLKEVKNIARDSETKIVNSKVTEISSKMR